TVFAAPSRASAASTLSLPDALPIFSQKEVPMRAYSVVRFKVKPGREQEFVDAHRIDPTFKGFLGGALIKTGERSYCLVGEWESFDRIVAAREKMIGMLD